MGGDLDMSKTREQRRYWRRERIKAVLVCVLASILWALVEVAT